MKSYKHFFFESYIFDAENFQLSLKYSFDHEVFFEEKIIFPASKENFDVAVLDRFAKFLWIMAGISYYKASYPAEIKFTNDSDLPEKSWSDFFQKIYRHGLGEFFVVNGLKIPSQIKFPFNETKNFKAKEIKTEGVFLPIGGGKDSLVSAALLKSADINFDSFFVNPKKLQLDCAEKLSGNSYTVTRHLDKKLFELNAQGALNGHVPISGIWAGIMLLSAALENKKYISLSNEASANVGNLAQDGLLVNHQYSKSLEFETDLQTLVTETITPSITYFSALRPLSELQIIKLFADNCWQNFAHTFASCNKNFKESAAKQSEIPVGNWCGNCSKCAFVFLLLAAVVPKKELLEVFGKNLFADESLQSTFAELCGVSGHKPFECVGEIAECREAAYLAAEKFSELDDLIQSFEKPKTSAFDGLAAHNIPAEIFSKLKF